MNTSRAEFALDCLVFEGRTLCQASSHIGNP